MNHLQKFSICNRKILLTAGVQDKQHIHTTLRKVTSVTSEAAAQPESHSASAILWSPPLDWWWEAHHYTDKLGNRFVLRTQQFSLVRTEQDRTLHSSKALGMVLQKHPQHHQKRGSMAVILMEKHKQFSPIVQLSQRVHPPEQRHILVPNSTCTKKHQTPPYCNIIQHHSWTKAKAWHSTSY